LVQRWLPAAPTWLTMMLEPPPPAEDATAQAGSALRLPAAPAAGLAVGLADAASHFQAVVDGQPELISVASLDGTLAYVNPAYARHFGLSTAAMVGTSLYAHVEPEDREAVRRLVASLAVSGQAATGENRMKAASGETLWVAWTNRVHSDSQGRPMLHSVGRDVTARRTAEAALRASQTFVARSGRIAGVGGWELDLASSQLTWSDETRRIHEVPDDFVPTLDKAIAFYAPEARPAIEVAVQHCLATGESWDLQLPIVTATGRSIWARAVGEVDRVDGQPVRLIGTFQDVTERHRLEQQVAESERFLRQLADSLPLRIAYLDTQRRYRFVNQELLRHFDRPAAEVLAAHGPNCDRAKTTPGWATARALRWPARPSSSSSRNGWRAACAASRTGWCPTPTPPGACAASSSPASTSRNAVATQRRCAS
jgi:PAS domain S-box-containing protein